MHQPCGAAALPGAEHVFHVCVCVCVCSEMCFFLMDQPSGTVALLGAVFSFHILFV